MSEPIKNRYEFTILFDVENGNPNGDPDAGNMPRVDPETGYGLVTDVCLKRKIRNCIETICEDKPGYRIYVKEGVPLQRSDKEALAYVGIDEKTDIKKMKKDDPELDRKICDFMCQNFFDIRAFGAVMTTFVKSALNCGQVRGPVQLGFARSIDPIMPQEVTITRVAITTEKDAENKNTEIGRKYIIPYALYRVDGYVSANLVAPFTGAWIEIRSSGVLGRYDSRSHPSRVRGLKLVHGFTDRDILAAGSHPSRVRGLKFMIRNKKKFFITVAPFTGAWIEMH